MLPANPRSYVGSNIVQILVTFKTWTIRFTATWQCDFKDLDCRQNLHIYHYVAHMSGFSILGLPLVSVNKFRRDLERSKSAMSSLSLLG